MFFFQWPAFRRASLPKIKLSEAELTLLMDALSIDDGWISTPILAQSPLSTPQKCHVLSLALSQNCYDFLNTLDVLSERFQLVSLCDRENNLLLEKASWFVSLKRLNDLVHNNEMLDAFGKIRRTQHYFFQNLSSHAYDSLQSNSPASEKYKKYIIDLFAPELTKSFPGDASARESCAKFERELVGVKSDPRWRYMLALPVDQQKGRAAYWGEFLPDQVSYWWGQRGNIASAMWEAADEMAAFTGCASAIDEYENRQQERLNI